MDSPNEMLQAGARILDPILTPLGFEFGLASEGRSSGGHFASAQFACGERRIEFYFRWSLGLVAYHFGEMTIAHEAYVWAVTGKRHAGAYPGFSDDPLEAFRGLASDLQEFFGVFLKGDSMGFASICKEAARLEQEWEKVPPFKRLSL